MALATLNETLIDAAEHGELDGVKKEAKAGDVVVVERGTKHSFFSQDGCIFEEISTTHYKNDSFYDDAAIMENKHRKTALTYWVD